MKKLITLALLTVILVSCNFSKGINTDLTTGLTYSYNGFGVSKVKVLYKNSEPIKGKTHPKGSSLKIELHGVKNYTEENGKIYPGCSVAVTDKEGNVVLESEDLYKDYKATKKDFQVPYITLDFGNSFSPGQEYTFNAHFFDKKNPENVIDIKLEFEVEQK